MDSRTKADFDLSKTSARDEELVEVSPEGD